MTAELIGRRRVGVFHGMADLTPERERFAEALAVERIHGDAAPQFIAQRINALASLGELAGVQRWREIAQRLDQLQRPRRRERWSISPM